MVVRGCPGLKQIFIYWLSAHQVAIMMNDLTQTHDEPQSKCLELGSDICKGITCNNWDCQGTWIQQRIK